MKSFPRVGFLALSLIISIVPLACGQPSPQRSPSTGHAIIAGSSSRASVPVTLYSEQFEGGSAQRMAHVVQGRLVIEGDILVAAALPPGGAPGQSAALAISSTSRLWPQGVIPYAIESGLSNSEEVKAAMAHWEENTGIRFVPASVQSDSLLFKGGIDGNICWSYLGRTGGQQPITLSGACGTAEIIHEIGHTVGLLHEQNRRDRDRFITINWDNIDPNFRDQFAMAANGKLIGDYDLMSIMHYTSWSFSTNGEPVMVTKSGETIQHASRLSPGDIAAVTSIYGFSAPETPTPNLTLAKAVLKEAIPPNTSCTYAVTNVGVADSRGAVLVQIAVKGPSNNELARVTINKTFLQPVNVKIVNAVLTHSPFDVCLH
jgi:Astacin (Peptidase family M12A)